MNEIKIYLKPSGSVAELYIDFNLYQGCYRNAQIAVCVPTSILYQNEEGTFMNIVRTGAILTAPNGAKVTTKSFLASFEKKTVYNGEEYAVFTQLMPKEYCLYVGTQTIVCNVVSIDSTNEKEPVLLSVTTSQKAQFVVHESAYLPEEEPLSEDSAEVLEGQINALSERLADGYYASRAVFAWNSEYAYGENELVYYPDKKELGAILKSIKAENKELPYVDGKLNARAWELIADFNELIGPQGEQGVSIETIRVGALSMKDGWTVIPFIITKSDGSEQTVSIQGKVVSGNIVDEGGVTKTDIKFSLRETNGNIFTHAVEIYAKNGNDALPLKFIGNEQGVWYDPNKIPEWVDLAEIQNQLLPDFDTTEDGDAYLVDDSEVKGQYDLYIHNHGASTWFVVNNWGGVPGRGIDKVESTDYEVSNGETITKLSVKYTNGDIDNNSIEVRARNGVVGNKIYRTTYPFTDVDIGNTIDVHSSLLMPWTNLLNTGDIIYFKDGFIGTVNSFENYIAKTYIFANVKGPDGADGSNIYTYIAIGEEFQELKQVTIDTQYIEPKPQSGIFKGGEPVITDDGYLLYVNDDKTPVSSTTVKCIMIKNLNGAGSAIKSITITNTSTATNGNLTTEQMSILQENDENYIIFDNEIYKLQDKQHDPGYLIYTHVGHNNANNFMIKCITITVSTRAWILTGQKVGSDYDLVIRTQEEFDTWCTSLVNNTCTIQSVLIVGKGSDYTYVVPEPTSVTSEVIALKIPDTLHVISGTNNASIKITSTSANAYSLIGIGYNNFGYTGYGYGTEIYQRRIDNIELTVIAKYNPVGIKYGCNIINCNVVCNNLSSGPGMSVGVYTNCRNITNSYGNHSQSTASIYYGCINIDNLNTNRLSTQTTLGVNYSISQMFVSCKNISNCYMLITSNTLTSVFSICNEITNCYIQLYSNYTGITRLFYNCTHISNCQYILNVSSSSGDPTVYAAYNCNYMSNVDCTVNVTGSSSPTVYVFYGCVGLNNINVNLKVTGPVGMFMRVFYNCSYCSNCKIIAPTISGYRWDGTITKRDDDSCDI